MRAKLYFVTILLLVFSCKTETKEELAPAEVNTNTLAPVTLTADKNDTTKSGLQKQIQVIEQKMSRELQIKKETGMEAIKLYKTYSDKFFKDSLSPDYMFKAGEISENLGLFSNAVFYYKNCYEGYPNYRYRAECLFRLANVYDFKLRDYIMAKQTYEEVIAMFPKHPLSKDASMAIVNMGKNDADLIREFEKKNGVKK